MGNKVKKIGTQQYLPKIREGFIRHMQENYGETKEHAEEILESFLKVIDDASRYGFSENHSTPYSYTGYIGAYLRYYYPLEFLTTILNIQEDDQEKTMKIIDYAKKKNVEIKPIAFGKSRAFYTLNRKEQAIYKGIASIKYLNAIVAEELYELAQNKEYDRNDWVGLLADIFEKCSINSKQMEILIRLDFIKEFGEKEVLLEIYQVMSDKKKADIDKYPEFADKEIIERKEKKNKKTGEVTIEEKKKTIKRPLKYDKTLKDETKKKRLENLRAYEKAVRANPPSKIELYEQIAFEKENLGYAYTTFPTLPSNIAIVLDVNKKYTPLLTLYRVKDGQEIYVKVDKKKFYTDTDQLLYVGDVIKVLDVEQRKGWKMVNGKFERDENKKEWYLNKCKLIKRVN